MQLPTGTDPEDEIKHWLIFHDLRWHHQDSQDDTGFASIHHVMRVVAQTCSTTFSLHQGGIWIGGTDTEIGQALRKYAENFMRLRESTNVGCRPCLTSCKHLRYVTGCEMGESGPGRKEKAPAWAGG